MVSNNLLPLLPEYYKKLQERNNSSIGPDLKKYPNNGVSLERINEEGQQTTLSAEEEKKNCFFCRRPTKDFDHSECRYLEPNPDVERVDPRKICPICFQMRLTEYHNVGVFHAECWEVVEKDLEELERMNMLMMNYFFFEEQFPKFNWQDLPKKRNSRSIIQSFQFFNTQIHGPCAINEFVDNDEHACANPIYPVRRLWTLWTIEDKIARFYCSKKCLDRHLRLLGYGKDETFRNHENKIFTQTPWMELQLEEVLESSNTNPKIVIIHGKKAQYTFFKLLEKMIEERNEAILDTDTDYLFTEITEGSGPEPL